MKTFVVIGLGRFGSAVATELSSLGHEVLAVDERETLFQSVNQVRPTLIRNNADELTYILHILIR